MKEVPSRPPTDTFLAALNDTQREAIGIIEADLDSIEQHDAESTFRVGDKLIAARVALPSGMFKQWYRTRRKYSRSYVADFIRVSEKLAPYRERFIIARAQRTVLIELGSKPEMAEAVLSFVEGGRRLSVSEVRSLLKEEGRSPADHELGGEKGMLQRIEAKKEHVRDLVRRIQTIIRTMEEELGAPKVGKEALYDQVYMDARWARIELYNLCAFVQPSAWDRHKPAPVEFEEGSGWARLSRLLYCLGGKETWPPARELRRWLEEEALPLLRWGSNDEPLPETDTQVSGASDLADGDVHEDEMAGAAPHASAVKHSQTTVPIRRSDARLEGVYEIRPAEDARWCPANLTPEGWVCLDGRRFPRLGGNITVRIEARYLDMGAQAVSALRRRGVRESASSEEIEKTCRQMAHVLGTTLNGSLLTEGEKPASVVAQHRTATAIYNASHAVPPMEPLGDPEVVLIPETAPTRGSVADLITTNSGRITAHIATWSAAMLANLGLPEPGVT